MLYICNIYTLKTTAINDFLNKLLSFVKYLVYIVNITVMNIQNCTIKLTILLVFLQLNSCGIYRPVDAKKFPPEPQKRVQKNLQEGRGLTLMGLGKDKKGGDFNFATSNEMWRASLDILDFMPLTSADYGGGLIITDWYNDEASSDQSVKISIRFLSNEIRTDALKITVFSKECEKNINCRISQSNPKIENELKVSILKRAAKYKKDMIDAEPKRDLNTIFTSDDRD